MQIENIHPAHPATYDSSLSASTENASKQVGDMISTIRSCLEEGIKLRVPVTRCLFSWRVEHGAWLPTTRQRQRDGLTPHQILRGDKCCYKISKGKRERALAGMLGSEWKEQLFLDDSTDSDEYLACCMQAKHSSEEGTCRGNHLQEDGAAISS